MPITKLKFKPGVISDITSESNEGGYVDGDKVDLDLAFQKSLVVGQSIALTLIKDQQDDYIIGLLLMVLISWVSVHISSII